MYYFFLININTINKISNYILNIYRILYKKLKLLINIIKLNQSFYRKTNIIKKNEIKLNNKKIFSFVEKNYFIIRNV